MTVGPDTQVIWTLKANEAAALLGLLGTQPINQAGETHTRLRMQTEAQLTAPPVPPAQEQAAVPKVSTPSADPLQDAYKDDSYYTEMVERAKRRIDSAENHRREPNGTLYDLAPIAGPDSDYAPAFSIIERAMHHLNESIPNRQLIRSEYAMSALKDGMVLATHWANSHLT